MDQQLEFLIWSCQKTTPSDKREWFDTTGYGAPFKMSFVDYIASTKDEGDSALVFHAAYERSSDTKDIRDERVQNAKDWYTYFTTGQIPTGLFDR